MKLGRVTERFSVPALRAIKVHASKVKKHSSGTKINLVFHSQLTGIYL